MSKYMYHRPIRRQRGFLMLQVSLALIITAILATEAIKTQVFVARMEAAALQGGNMAVLRAAGGKYVADFYRDLQNGAIVAKVTPAGTVTLAVGTAPGQTYAPSVANLIAMGYLTAGFVGESSFSNGPAPGSYRIKVELEPAGCVPAECDVVGYVYPNLPITAADSAEPDGPAISAMIAPLVENGGFSLNVTPETVYGNGGGWTWANPLAGTPAGVVVAKFGYGSSGLSQFVRMNDDRDPKLQNTLTVSKGITADTLATTTKIAGSACDAATQDNALASGAGTVLICTNNVWTALAERSTLGAACTVDGVVATSSVTGEQLICKNAIYRKSASYMAQNILQSRVTVKDLDIVTKPTCAVGFSADRLITLTQISTDVSVAPPYQGMYATTIDLGTSWQVVIRLRTDTGTEASGNIYNISAVMNLECTLD